MGNLAYRETALDRFYNNLAYKPWCGDDKQANLVRSKASAIRKEYIAPNPPALVYWLVFDLDIDVAKVFVWEDRNLPVPNIVVKNRNNDRQHLYYAITPVCVSENARKKPIYYMKAIARGLGKALGADPSFNGRIAKNPLSENWKVMELHSEEYSLDELGEYAAPVSEVFDPFKNAEMPDSRNCTLFERLRYWAYANVELYREIGKWSHWDKAVLEHALSISTLEVDFTYNEIKNTAKSVAKWTWNHYFGSSIHRGAMSLQNTDIPLSSKQRLAARRTHEIRSNETQTKIIASIALLLKQGIKVTKSAVAKDIGLSRQQISRRYAHLFEELFLKSIKIKEEANKQIDCLLWCNQISAGLRGLSTKEEMTNVSLGFIERVEMHDEGD